MNMIKASDYLSTSGVFAQAFPVDLSSSISSAQLDQDIVSISANFNKKGSKSPFLEAGIMKEGRYFTSKIEPKYVGEFSVLEDILQPLNEVTEEFYIPKEKRKGWEWQKGAKSLERTSRNGHRYTFSEGKMAFPDAIDKSSRTIVTGEGGPSPSRFKHVVEQNGVLRRLTPKELERLNMFPDDHTKLKGIRDAKRAFFMGNALVTGVVERLGKTLHRHLT